MNAYGVLTGVLKKVQAEVFGSIGVVYATLVIKRSDVEEIPRGDFRYVLETNLRVDLSLTIGVLLIRVVIHMV